MTTSSSTWQYMTLHFYLHDHICFTLGHTKILIEWKKLYFTVQTIQLCDILLLNVFLLLLLLLANSNCFHVQSVVSTFRLRHASIMQRRVSRSELRHHRRTTGWPAARAASLWHHRTVRWRRSGVGSDRIVARSWGILTLTWHEKMSMSLSCIPAIL